MNFILFSIIIGSFLLAFYFISKKLYRIANNKIYRLPLKELGFKNLPGFPFQISEVIKTIVLLAERSFESKQAQNCLSNFYTIKNITTSGYEFLFGENYLLIDEDTKEKVIRDTENLNLKMLIAPKIFLNSYAKKKLQDESFTQDKFIKDGVDLKSLFLERPDQFSMIITNFQNQYNDSKENIKISAKTLTDIDTANKEFWETLAINTQYNLKVLEKVDEEKLLQLQDKYLDTWTEDFTALANNNQLYAIDMTIFENIETSEVKGFPRFTPATYTLLKQDSKTKTLSPIAIWVSNYQGNKTQHYNLASCTPGSWIYALQASKTSVTCHGIFLGHLYQWHLVTAAMLMEMINYIPDIHPIYKLLKPISDYIIGFNASLVSAFTDIAPPTGISTSKKFFQLTNAYAKNRNFHDDDPKEYLRQNFIEERNFSHKSSWDRYPLMKDLLDIWDATEDYITCFVEQTYSSNESVRSDKILQNWIKMASSEEGGNIQGLPIMNTKHKLVQLLTSITYRINVHGISRIIPGSGYPAYAYPYISCLQRTDFPLPEYDLSTKNLLTYLPNTGSLGEMVTFGYIFQHSAPYKPALPLGGLDQDLFFSDQDISDKRNIALIEYREFLQRFIKKQSPLCQTHQWPKNIET